tara:strand:- start:490 stop:1458 length:969 start_codon:yes stop_codon:yes gene_type:complete
VYRGLIISSGFHIAIVTMSILALPFVAKKPLDIPPLISVELIQIAEETNIPFAPKASKIIEKVKQENEKLLSEQAPPKKIKKDEKKEVKTNEKKNEISKVSSKKAPIEQKQKEKLKKDKLNAVPMPEKEKQKIQPKEEKKQKPSKEINDENIKKIVETKKPLLDEKKVKQESEFEKKEILDLNTIAALIDKKKENLAETKKDIDKISQSTDNTMDYSKLTLSEEDALKAQIFTCWSVPIGLPFSEDLLVRVKLELKPDGTVDKLEMLDHIKMNTPGQEKFRTLADSVRRAIQLCNPLKVPTSGYERWKNMILNFDARDMLGG